MSKESRDGEGELSSQIKLRYHYRASFFTECLHLRSNSINKQFSGLVLHNEQQKYLELANAEATLTFLSQIPRELRVACLQSAKSIFESKL